MSSSERSKSLVREFAPSTLAVTNKVTVIVVAIIIAIGGYFSYVSMPKELYPEITLSTIYINTIYPGNSPTDIENLITRHLEKELNVIKGVSKIESTSSQDVSTIIVEFNEEVSIEEAIRECKNAVDRSKKDLPNDLDNDPSVIELDFSEIPIVTINLSGNFDIDDLKSYADYLKDNLEDLPEVSKVDISGSREREIEISADLYKMETRSVTFSDIESAVNSENISVSVGDILIDGYRRSSRVVSELKSVEQLANIIVKSEDERPVFLKDIATVSNAYADTRSYARLLNNARGDFYPVISLRVIKKSGENLIAASNKINEMLYKSKSRCVSC